MEFGFFVGCVIPYRLPNMEVTARKVLENLGVELHEIKGATCCPDPIAIKTTGEESYLLTAARNLCLAESQGLDILTPCNGCYETLKSVNSRLRLDRTLVKNLNKALSKIGLEYKGTVEVKHLVELLYKDIGAGKIQRSVVRPLNGLNVAVHYGCHLLRPSNALFFDDPLNPVSVDRLVEWIGARSVKYDDKMLCCGGAISLVNREDSMSLVRQKVSAIQKVGADCLVVVCPYCMLQYDLGQFLLKREEPKTWTPVFYYPELLALAMGIDLGETELSMHKIDVKQVLAKISRKREEFQRVSELFDVNFLRKCIECQACSEDCPMARFYDVDLKEILSKLLDGDLESVLHRREPWYCLSCYTCLELCPQRIGLADIFLKIKHLATDKGILPEGIRKVRDKFLASGMTVDRTSVMRKKLGLPDLSEPNVKDMHKLLENKKGLVSKHEVE